MCTPGCAFHINKLPGNKTRGSTSYKLQSVKTKSEASKQCFIVSAIKQWHDQPNDVTILIPIKMFLTKLILFLVNNIEV